MYTILNKQNDYRTNKSKLTLMENKYIALKKLISNQDGNLTEAMLLDIKEKQDFTYLKVLELWEYIKTFSPNFRNPNLNYKTLETSNLKPYEEGFVNYVDMQLLTSIMSNEVILSNFSKSGAIDYIWEFYNSYFDIKFSIDKSFLPIDYRYSVFYKNKPHDFSNHVATVIGFIQNAQYYSVYFIVSNFITGKKIYKEVARHIIYSGGTLDPANGFTANIIWSNNIANISGTINYSGSKTLTYNDSIEITGNILPVTNYKGNITVLEASKIFNV